MSESGKLIDIGQPIDGLLYDLNLLPEQLRPNTREYAAMFVISALHAELVKLRTPAPKAEPQEQSEVCGYCKGLKQLHYGEGKDNCHVCQGTGRKPK